MKLRWPLNLESAKFRYVSWGSTGWLSRERWDVTEVVTFHASLL